MRDLDIRAVEALGWELIEDKGYWSWHNDRREVTLTSRYKVGKTDRDSVLLPTGLRISTNDVAARITRDELRDAGWKVIDTGKMYVAERVGEAGSSLECYGLFPNGGIEGESEMIRTAKLVVAIHEDEHRDLF